MQCFGVQHIVTKIRDSKYVFWGWEEPNASLKVIWITKKVIWITKSDNKSNRGDLTEDRETKIETAPMAGAA